GREAAAARTAGYDSLSAASARAWRQRWDTDIEIDGDPALQRLVRSMLFYLLSSTDAGTALGIPPMGLSSGGYYGHVFWDSDTWMFPPLLLTIRMSRTPWWRSDGGRSMRRGPMPAPTGTRAPCIRGRPMSGATKPHHGSRYRTPVPRSTSTATLHWPNGSTTWPPATRPGSRATDFPSSAKPPTSG